MTECIEITRFKKNELSKQEDLVIIEHKVNIFVNGEHYISLMCLPKNLEELAVGFLFSEGLISSYAEITSIDSSDNENIKIDIIPSLPKPSLKREWLAEPGDSQIQKARTIVSGFSQGSVNPPFFNKDNLPIINSQIQIKSGEIINMATHFNGQSELFQETGAVHSCMLISDGKEILYEDIGRHNAIDKIIGKALITNTPPHNGILLTSGRISSEMLIKTARINIPVLISTSAPTNMAVQIANDINMTLIGFTRTNRFNIYSGNHRVIQ